MAKRKVECWKELGWIRGEQLRDKEGCQSLAFLARRNSDPEDTYKYVLKKLRRQDDPERRAMFYNETLAINTLEHSGVLPVVQTNAEDYKTPVELFMITPFAEGKDLDDLVDSGLDFEDSIRIVLGVLDIVDHCHARGVIHRDIKPCHVIVPSEKVDSPILIDFGLAYCEEIQPTDAATGQEVRKGNRFLIGPEHLHGSALVNRSGITDITQCVGLLFFALTQRYPGLLLDEDERKPHERGNDAIDSTIESWKREWLEALFARGFEWHPDKRWQSTGDLRTRLERLLELHLNPDDSLKLRLDRTIQDSRVEATVANLKKAQDLAEKLRSLITEIVAVIRDATHDFAELKTMDQHAQSVVLEAGTYSLSYTIIHFAVKHKLAPSGIAVVSSLESAQFVVRIMGYTGAFSIFGKPGPFRSAQQVELGRWDVDCPDYVIELRPKLEENLLLCVKDVLSDQNG